MKKHYAITFRVGLVAALMATVAAPASANPLLSGYSGPGQGSQAILGSALVKGPPGGGGGSGNGSLSTSASLTGVAVSSSSANATSKRANARQHGAAPGKGSPQRTSKAPVGGASSGQLITAGAASSAPAATLGLSSADFLYIILALGAVMFTGALTKRLTRELSTKGHGR